MIGGALLALMMGLHSTNSSFGWPEPPEEMIDFLGRRQLCLSLSEPPGRTAYAEEEWQRLSCSTLVEEEARWRARYGDDGNVLRWLDQEPQEFQIPQIVAHSYHGPPVAEARQVIIEGTGARPEISFRLVADKNADGGRLIKFTASFADVPSRTFTIESARFPLLDLQSITVAQGREPPDEELLVMLRYGYPRGYCGDIDIDDRPRISIRFTRTEISGFYEDRTNCGTNSRELADARNARD